MPEAMLPLTNMSMQEAARAWRPAAVLAAANEGRSVGAGRPSQGHQHFQVGMESLELLDGRKISIERPRIRVTVHAGQVWRLIVGPTIGNRACRRRSGRDIAKSVEQMRQFIGHTILLQVRNVVAGVIDTPLFEVSPENLALFMVLCE